MAVPYQQPRRRFTVDEYHKMTDAGILGEDDRVELLDGEMVGKHPKKVVEIYSNPEGGKYSNVQRVGRGHTIAPQALPDVTIRVDDFLGA